MKKLRLLLDRLEAGEKIKNCALSLSDIRILQYIYDDLLDKKESTFISANCYNILITCGLTVKEMGIGWIITR